MSILHDDDDRLFIWEFTKTIIPFALVGYEVIITNSRVALVGYFCHFISNAGSWNNC